MSKSTLGRGLGDLLGSNRTESSPSAPMKPPGVGLRILIEGGSPPQTEPAPAPDVAPARGSDGAFLTRLLAVVGLIGADVALLGWTAQHVFTHQGRLAALDLAACISTVLLSTLCGCAAARFGMKT